MGASERGVCALKASWPWCMRAMLGLPLRPRLATASLFLESLSAGRGMLESNEQAHAQMSTVFCVLGGRRTATGLILRDR